MSCASVIASSARCALSWVVGAAALLALLVSAGCSLNGEEEPGETVLSTRSGETTIQVTETEKAGVQLVRVVTTFRGKESVVNLQIDQPVYEVEIPLSVEQQAPQLKGGEGGREGNFEDLLIAQYLEKAQQAFLDGDYNQALRQVNTVLQIRPDHVPALTMKGSVYYGMGNYQLANETWEEVLALDPSNQEVRDFQEFLKNRSGAPQPPLPGAPEEGGGDAPPQAPAPQTSPQSGGGAAPAPQEG